MVIGFPVMSITENVLSMVLQDFTTTFGESGGAHSKRTSRAGVLQPNMFHHPKLEAFVRREADLMPFKHVPLLDCLVQACLFECVTLI